MADCCLEILERRDGASPVLPWPVASCNKSLSISSSGSKGLLSPPLDLTH